MYLAQAKLLWSMCLFEAQRFRAYPLELVASIFGRLAETALYTSFWLIVATLSGGNIQPIDIISYYLIISGLIPFFNLNLGVASMTLDRIKTGELSQTLLKPVSPILFPWATRTGRSLFNYIVGILQIVVGISLIGGIRSEALPFLIPVLFNTFCINASFNIMVGALGFYFTEARNLKNAWLHIASFARGEKMPLHFMPPGLASFLLFTPFPASQYHLTIVLQGVRYPAWTDVLIGCVWSVILLFAAIKFWKFSLRRYEATGL
jgi:ABC-2 type transport system permease protein